jgi:nucleotide-binding universal stress UspA family protein
MELVGIILAVNLTCAVVAAWLAKRWGRDPFSWVLVCAVLGPFGLIALFAVRSSGETPVVELQEEGSGVGPRVIVPVDGSEHGVGAAQYVADAFGKSLGQVLLLAVLPLERADALRESESSPRRAELDEEIGRHLKGAEDVVRQAGVPYKTEVRFGDPAAEILAAASGGYDLIVMGRRGRGGVKKLLLGSVSERVVKDARCPVTVVG